MPPPAVSMASPKAMLLFVDCAAHLRKQQAPHAEISQRGLTMATVSSGRGLDDSCITAASSGVDAEAEAYSTLPGTQWRTLKPFSTCATLDHHCGASGAPQIKGQNFGVFERRGLGLRPFTSILVFIYSISTYTACSPLKYLGSSRLMRVSSALPILLRPLDSTELTLIDRPPTPACSPEGYQQGSISFLYGSIVPTPSASRISAG